MLRNGARECPRLVLAPRRPRRAAALCRLARRHGLAVHRAGAGPAAGWDVLVLDELGRLAPLYAFAALAFVGGTLARRGGQTPIEAAAHGVPLLAGPHCAHIAELAETLEAAGGLLRLHGSRDLLPAWRALLADPPRRRRMGDAARAAVAERIAPAAAAACAVRDLISRAAARPVVFPESRR